MSYPVICSKPMASDANLGCCLYVTSFDGELQSRKYCIGVIYLEAMGESDTIGS